jgi:hypothetical protein
VVGVVALLALALAGCGAESHPNEPRPQVPTRVSITISPKAITVGPGKVAFGPERTQQIPQNQNHPQPPIKTKRPLDVIFVVANQTTHTALVKVRGRGGEVLFTSEKIPPVSPATFPAELPTSNYTVTAAGIPAEPTTELHVGPYRASSENDVLLP